jgi:esterase/lipase
MNRKYCKTLTGKKKYTVLLVHGFRSSKDRVIELYGKKLHDMGYTVMACDAVGHNGRDGDIIEWYDTLLELKSIIESMKSTILVGTSMGGTISISLGLICNNVIQVFAISPVGGFLEPSFDISLRRKLLYWKIPASNEIPRQVKMAFPNNYASCKPVNANKFFLVHSKNDGLAEYEDFLVLKKKLCIPDKNVLVYNMKSIFPMIDHALTSSDEHTLQFILDNIKQ